MTVDSIVKTSVLENLALIAITDHNEIRSDNGPEFVAQRLRQWLGNLGTGTLYIEPGSPWENGYCESFNGKFVNVESAIKAAHGSAVTVIPGVELSTPEGHLLVYCATVDDLTSFYGKLTFAGKGTANYRCQSSLLECLNKIDPTRGYAILAHVDAEGGLEKKVQGNPPHKRDIITHPSLLGIELRSAGSDISYADSDTDLDRRSMGQERIDALSLGNKQFLARVLFSDAHSVSALGKNAAGQRRITRMKMDSPSFAGLRVALQDADARIRIEEKIP